MRSTWFKRTFVHLVGGAYRLLRPVFFLFESDPIHEFVLDMSESFGKVPGMPGFMRWCLRVSDPSLRTSVAGIEFDNPVGLSAGFDHEVQMPRVVSGIGFGFESVGTVTNGAYGGNPPPMQKRLVKTRTILVNKGFKSTGIDAILSRLKDGRPWDVPIGISLGQTNRADYQSHEDVIADIVAAFRKAIASRVPFSYFELNISCPNLMKKIEFFDPARFSQLLEAITALDLPKPLFIKMPINLNDDETRALLDTMLRFPVAAAIFGNLQHDRSNPAFDQKELATLMPYAGNWSGMPCQQRSDELVKLAYRHLKEHGALNRLSIIGCGGIFKAADAYRKIRLGASLVQLNTATIFEGPQVPAEICADLPALLKRDGFANVREAVGVDAA